MPDFSTDITQKIGPKSRFSFTDEIYINFEKSGYGKKSIIFLHGFGLSLYSWEEVKHKIDTSKFTLYLIDLKGFGFSYKGRSGSYSLEEQASIITAFIKTHNLTAITLVGHSYGGMIALYLVYQNNIKNLNIEIEKLVLLDTPAFINAQPLFLTALRNPILNFISLKLLTPRMNAIFTIKNTFYNKSYGLTKYLNIYKYFFNQPNAKKAMTLAARNIYPQDISDFIKFYPLITIPTLILWGEKDKLIPLSFGNQLQKVIHNATLIIINDCGHVPNEEKPDLTAQHINEFLLK